MSASTPVTFTRRRFLVGAGTAAASAFVLPSIVPRFAFATPNDPDAGDVIVAVFLRGGADGLSLVVPYTDHAYHHHRGMGTANDISVPPPDPGDPTNSALALEGGGGLADFGLHPGLGGADGSGGLMGVWDAGHLAIVHAVGMPASESATRSHFEAQANWDRGTADLGVSTGWLARYISALGSPDGIPGIGHGPTLPGNLRGQSRAMALTSIDAFGVNGFADDEAAQGVLTAVYGPSDDLLLQQGADTLAAVELMEAADPGQYDDNAALYEGLRPPFDRFANGLRETAQLIRADIGLRVACVDVGNWDTHDQMGPVTGGWMRDQATGLSDALTAFHDDLGDLMDEVTVVVMSEFGRCIHVNGNNGTDHGRGGVMFVMGGGVNRGVWGDYPDGPLHDGPEGDLAVANDMRAVLTELLVTRGALADPSTVFPGYRHPGDLGIVS